MEKKVFSFILILILIGGFLNPIINPDDFNYIENRNAIKLPKLKFKSILNKTFQDDFEKSLADQIPLSSKMKTIEKTSDLIIKKTFSNILNKSNLDLGGVFIRDNYLLYSVRNLNETKPYLKSKVENYNNTINKIDNVEFYIYYIEKETDINFDNNEKLGAYEYMKSLLSDKFKTTNFEINDFETFKKYYYKTDHHWNYKGSYKAYLELTDLLEIKTKVKIKNEICTNIKWSGSKSRSIGGSIIFNEEFCAYQFELPEHLTYINNDLVESYGDYKKILDGTNNTVSYGLFYGGDDGLVKFDYNDDSKQNLLIIGESYDNAINEILSSHFNETYNVDLRAYEMDLNKKFDIKGFIRENDIDKVLLIGNIDYFIMDKFLLS